MRDVVTTLFELLGLLALAVAAGMAAWTFVAPPAGVGGAGVLLVVFSWIIDRRGRDS